MIKVLVVEDEKSLRDPLVFLLEKEGYEVIEAADGNQALEQFARGGVDLILLDLMLPGLSGTEVCRRIRQTSRVPIIMLTAKDSEIDKVVGLEIGADDYVTKPYSTRELAARMNAVLRRQRSSGGGAGAGYGADPTNLDSLEAAAAARRGAKDSGLGVVEAGPVKIDLDRHMVFLNGKSISMPLKEFELLEFLLENANRVLTRSQIIDRVWGADYFGDTKTLDVHIKRIRGKIEIDPGNPVHVQTVRGVGYKFEA